MPITRRATASIVTIIILISFGVVFINITGILVPLEQTYHFESYVNPETAKGNFSVIKLINMDDCNLTVSCVDNPELVYSVDIEFYEPTRAGYDFKITQRDQSFELGVSDFTSESFKAELVRMKSVNLVLGSGFVYHLRIHGGKLNSSIVLENEVHLDQYFQYLANGTLKISFENDVNYPRGWFSADFDQDSDRFEDYYLFDIVNITIDLPSIAACEILANCDTFVLLENVGWTQVSIWNSYRSGNFENSDYRLHIDIDASTTYATLLAET